LLFERPFSTDLQMKTGAFVILGHAFTYIINDLVTGLRAEGGLKYAAESEGTELRNRYSLRTEI
jgi:hypothetical protein